MTKKTAKRAVLTDAAIKSFKVRETQYEVFDPAIPAFSIRISPKGKKSFCLSYRVKPNTPLKRYTIGSHPALKLTDARKKALDIKANLEHGIDPAAEKKAARVQKTVPEAAVPEINSVPTFSDMTTFYIEQKKLTLKGRGAEELAYMLKGKFVSVLGEKLVTDVSEEDLQDIIDGLMEDGKGGAANHAVADIKRCFAWIVDRKNRAAIKSHFKWNMEETDLKLSPADALDKPSEYKPRRRVLSLEELGQIYYAADEMVTDGIATNNKLWAQYGNIAKLLILSAARRTQIAHIKWGKYNQEERFLITTSKKRGDGQELLIPLTEKMMEVLESVERQAGCPYIFYGTNSTAFSAFSDGLAELRIRCGSNDAKGKLLWEEGWNPHDIRRSFSTVFAMPKLGVPREVTEAVLDHTPTGGGAASSQIAQIYNLYEYYDEKREALTKWETLVMKEVAAAASKKGQIALAA